MKKKILLSALLGVLTLCLVVILASCMGSGSGVDCAHEWNELSRQDAGCEKPGVLERECIKCGQRDNQYLDPIGHTIVEHKGYAATCTEPGLGDGTYCEMCKYELQPRYEISPKGHNYQTVPGYKATCFENGLSDGEACADCGEILIAQTVILSTGHNWVTDYGYYATCESEGLTSGSHCYACGEIGEKQEVIPALGHYFVSAGGYDSTCTVPGYSYGTYCQNCYITGEGEKELPLADHTPVIDEGYAPTCTQNGLADGSHCEVCKTVIDEQAIIEYLGHKVVSFGGVASTCESKGSTAGKKCETCEYIFAESVALPKATHSFKNGTCTVCQLTVSSGLSYEKNSDGNGYIVIGKGDFSGNELVVPDVYEGLPVLAIGEGAFKNENLTSVVLTGETTAIKAGAFEGCTALTEVKLPESVVEVDENAFGGCTSLEYIACEDFAQSYEWSESWSGNENILIKSEQKDGLTAFEIYLLAMETMQKNIDRFAMDVNQKIDVYMQGALLQSTNKKQYYECVLDDLYSYQYDGQAETRVWYIDEVTYLVQDGGYYKMEASPEYFRDYTNQMMEALNVFEEKYFDNAEFYRNADGTYTLILVMSNENMAELVERVLGITDNSVNMTSCIYSYNFDANGYLTDMYADAEFSMSASGYTAFGVLDQDVVLTDVGTLESVTQPQGSFIDVTNKSCTHPNSKRVTVKGFDATCTEDGITDGIYCSNCYATIKYSEKIEAEGHKLENGKCTVCGMLENQSTGLYYEISEDGKAVYIAGMGTFDGTDVVVPEKMFGLPVVGIKAGAFDGSNITSITLPKSMTEIETGAFDGCEALRKVECPLWIVSSLPQRVDSLTITDGTSISQNDFSNLTELKIIELPKSITEIADGAFENCTKLTIIYNYSSLEIIEGDETANGGIAKNAKRIYRIKRGGEEFIPVGDFLFFKTFTSCELAFYLGNSETVVLPDSVNGKTYYIPEWVFKNHTEIVSLTIPQGVESIESYAFNGCTNIKYLTAESKYLRYIPYDSLIEITFLGERIDATFYGGNVVSVTIPATVTAITGSFGDCSSLTTVNYLGSIEDWCNISFSGYGSNPLHRGANLCLNGELVTDIVIPDTVTQIKDYAFYGCKSLTSVKIGSGVTSIGAYAFYDCSSLASVTIDSGVTSIEYDAFRNCTSLTSVTIPDSITSIGSNAFYYCTSLTSVTIGKDVSSIGYDAFVCCYKLVEVYNLSSSLNITVGSYYENGAVGYYAKIVHTSLDEESILKTTEDGYVFAVVGENEVYLVDYVGNETELTLPESYNGNNYGISQYAFYKRDDITKVTIPDGVTSIGNSAFGDCVALSEINFNATAMKSLSQNNNAFAFAGQNGDGIKVTIGKNVTQIPAYLFDSANYITSVVFEEGSVCEAIRNYAFRNCSSLLSITIPNSVASIEDEAFRNCTKLTSIIIPDSVTYIGYNAFSGCFKLVEVYNLSKLNITAGSTNNGNVGFWAKVIHTSLDEESILKATEDGYVFVIVSEDEIYLINYIGNDRELTLPESYNGNNYQIYEYAFYYRNDITKVTIPDSITFIDRFVFQYCDSLTSVTFENASGWYVTQTNGATSGRDIDVTNTSTNANYLKSTYYNYYWYKK